MPALVAHVADGEADLLAGLLAAAAQLAREALPRAPQVGPLLERLVEAREVEAVEARTTLQHVTRRLDKRLRVDLVAIGHARLA